MSARLDAVRAEWAKLQAEWPELQRWNLTVCTRSKQRLGVCRFNKREIALAAWLLSTGDVDEVIDTLRHEAAHALAGASARHGAQWRAWARRLGARPECYAPASVAKSAPAPWKAICPTCGIVGAYTREPIWSRDKNRKAYCSTCKSDVTCERRAV